MIGGSKLLPLKKFKLLRVWAIAILANASLEELPGDRTLAEGGHEVPIPVVNLSSSSLLSSIGFSDLRHQKSTLEIRVSLHAISEDSQGNQGGHGEVPRARSD
ncbi:unnamed protein product [Ilex paraguariensis]|uniref:Uncharacterized protein n=1 Tax=Ilex paraguariensis TaxID=185542 RepID=A0ABC8UMJ0_9AQUA